MPDDSVATAQATGDGLASNPLRAGLPEDSVTTDPCSIVFFGASGDLFKRMLLPAIYSMRLNGTLPTDFALVGLSRTEFPNDKFQDYCKQQLDTFMPDGQKPQGELWEDFCKRLSYISADFKDNKCFTQLKG